MPTVFDVSQAPSNQTNILINGGMDFWQRNILFTNISSGTYTADRWVLSKAGAGTPSFTISRETGAANVDSGASSMKLDITVLSTMTQCQMVQSVEDFASYKGKTITVSARIKTGTSAFQIAIFDGISASFSTHSGSGAFETITLTKTLSASTSVLQIGIGFVSTQSVVSTSYIDSVMLVIGSAPAVFIPKDPATEFVQCQRYFEKSYAPLQPVGTNTGTGTVYIPMAGATTSVIQYATLQFRVQKRTTPIVTGYKSDGTLAQWEVRDNGTIVGSGTPAFDQTDGYNTRIRITGISPAAIVVSASSNWYAAFGHWTADAEI